MTIYQVRQVVSDEGIRRFVVIAVDDDGSERQLVVCDTEEEAKEGARTANLWWNSPVQKVKRAGSARYPRRRF
jgi:hypothetical protein